MIIVTEHGMKRIRERVGLKKKAVERHVLNVLSKGTPAAKTKGSLKKWLDAKKETDQYVKTPWAAERTEYWVYGDKFYVFANSCGCMFLITCVQIPPCLTRKIKMLQGC